MTAVTAPAVVNLRQKKIRMSGLYPTFFLGPRFRIRQGLYLCRWKLFS
jgi:hypothetical protein